MPQVILPEKYYLTHFNELRHFICSTSLSLLNEAQLARFHSLEVLSEDALCLLIRLFSRKHQVFEQTTLIYKEIDDVPTRILELFESGWVCSLSSEYLNEFLLSLNKTQLQALSCDLNLTGISKSAKKAQWQAYLTDTQYSELIINSEFAKQFIILGSQTDFDYWQFLFFGSGSGQINQFSLRDMGILSTRQNKSTFQQARFDDIAIAQFAFNLSQWTAISKTMVEEALVSTARSALDALSELKHIDDPALIERYHHLLLRMSTKLEKIDEVLAEHCFMQSEHPKAIEKKIRRHFQNGDIATCKSLLEGVLAEPENEELILFAEDFWQRKFEHKRTSILTDVLRNSVSTLAIDEAFKNQVEQGVCEYYHRLGFSALHVENTLWRVLFGLVFWRELYEHEKSGVFNEFQRTPKVLKQNQFYRVLANEVDTRLASIHTSNDLKKLLIDHSTRYFGEPNSLFYWHSELLEPLILLLENAPIESIKAHLLAMTKDFKGLKDGYPDLVIVDGAGLRFEEIKAPGDVLRRNQLVSIRALIQAGFKVGVQTVQWQLDPKQLYVVVDLETTGGKAQNDRITEIAIVKYRNGEIVDSWSSLVNPERRIPQFIIGLTGISDEMVQGAPTFGEIMDVVAEKLQEGIFVAHNVNFDYGFLKQSFLRHGRTFQRPKLCTVQLARKFLPGHTSYSLGKLCAALDIELRDHHRALADATATAHLLGLVNEQRLAKNM
ncbi:exonuclease domain-containing protein [Pseudoalteromonas xiamenensis]